MRKTRTSPSLGGAGGPSSFSRRQVLVGAGGVAAVAGLAACSGGTSPGASSSPTGPAQAGGNFRVGLVGGGAKDLIDAQYFASVPDGARMYSAWETLLAFDNEFKLTSDGLAESVEADNPTQYTIRLRQGIEFHNGKTLTADDVIYSLLRVGKQGDVLTLQGYPASQTMDLDGIKKMDEYTVRLPLKVPNSTIPFSLAGYGFGIVPEGYERYAGDLSTQVGTGAFKFKSFTPGRESVSERYPNYWRDSWVDEVTIINFSDVTGTVNALLSGQIDAMTDLPPGQIESVESRGGKVLEAEGAGFWIPICMAIDEPPFDDPRVRQAFRLIVDRQAMLDQVGSGYGRIGNDLYAPFDDGYFDELPQRERDIDEAKALLKAAGQENLIVDLYTTNATPGQVTIATVFAEQAKDAGVTVNVRNLPTSDFYSDNYLKWPLSTDYWAHRLYLPQADACALPTSTGNETHWPPKSGEGSNFESLYNKALATTDDAQWIALQHEMQQLEYDLGGYIIPFFPSRFDAHATNVQGLSPAVSTLGLGNFGHGFRDIWFS